MRPGIVSKLAEAWPDVSGCVLWRGGGSVSIRVSVEKAGGKVGTLGFGLVLLL